MICSFYFFCDLCLPHLIVLVPDLEPQECFTVCLNDQAIIAWFTSTRGTYQLRLRILSLNFIRDWWKSIKGKEKWVNDRYEMLTICWRFLKRTTYVPCFQQVMAVFDSGDQWSLPSERNLKLFVSLSWVWTHEILVRVV